MFSFNTLIDIVKRPPIVFVEGKGSWLIDADGKRYLDFTQGWAVNSLGHCAEPVVQAVCEQANKLINPSPAYYNDQMIRLAELLVNNSCMDKVFFANSGAEANEGAVKLARKWGNKSQNGAYEIITFNRAFHGRTLAMMSASGKPQWENLFEPKIPGFPKAVFNNIDSVEALIGPKTVGIMLEPIQGEAGIFPATKDFIKALRQLCDKYNLLLIFDEIQTGIGRTGKLFAYELYDIEPDIMTLGKGIGSGVPLSALLCKEEFSCFEPGDQGGTYNGNPLIASVGCAVLNTIISKGFLPSVVQKSDYLKKSLMTVSVEFSLGEVRGEGLLLALNLSRSRLHQSDGIKYNGADLVTKVLNSTDHGYGLILNSPNADTLRFVPSLTVSTEEIDQMIQILKGCL